VRRAPATDARLEDAVAEPAKPAARDTVATALGQRAREGARCAVRINALDGPFASDDPPMATDAGADAIVVPKARADSLRELDPSSLPPIVAIVELADEDGLRRECELARSLGFGGKACIHPRQVPVVERAFAPAPAELEWARRVVDAYEAARRTGAGVVRVDGAMVDLPVYERALDIAGDERVR
jgi:citrate lyase beta subunit